MPKAVIFGLSPEQFWYGEPNLLWIYEKAYSEQQELSIERKRHEMNTQAWFDGLYIRKAIVSAFNKAATYPMKPETLPKSEKADDLTPEERAERDAELIKAQVVEMKSALKNGAKAGLAKLQALAAANANNAVPEES